jgi:hypothetical protein
MVSATPTVGQVVMTTIKSAAMGIRVKMPKTTWKLKPFAAKADGRILRRHG